MVSMGSNPRNGRVPLKSHPRRNRPHNVDRRGKSGLLYSKPVSDLQVRSIEGFNLLHRCRPVRPTLNIGKDFPNTFDWSLDFACDRRHHRHSARLPLLSHHRSPNENQSNHP